MPVPAMAGRLVARSVEWETLWSAVERAAAGESATVVVAGEAGVGKSRLVEELARTAEDQGIRVLVGRCVDIGDGELPYAPIAGALRGLLASLSAEDAEGIFGPDRAVLGRLVPELAGPDDGASDPPATFAKARLFELVLRTLGRLGDRAPVLLVVEDLHWADGSTRDLLRFLVRSAVRERLALVLTSRTEGLARGHPLRPYLVELGRDPRVTRITLAPFTRAELADHVAMLRTTPLPAAALDRLYERSEGNAFYTEELLAAAGETGSGPLPASLAEALLVRLERLPGPARHVVRVAAAAGRRVDHELVARAAGARRGRAGRRPARGGRRGGAGAVRAGRCLRVPARAAARGGVRRGAPGRAGAAACGAGPRPRGASGAGRARDRGRGRARASLAGRRAARGGAGRLRASGA